MEKPKCETCDYWAFLWGTSNENGETLEEQGECRIRSIDGSFPDRFSDEFCGEHSGFSEWQKNKKDGHDTAS